MTEKYLAPIIMGSPKDWMPYGKELSEELTRLDIPWKARVASAHRTADKLENIVHEYDSNYDVLVYITLAGLSNGLSGATAGLTRHFVIAHPIPSQEDLTLDYASSYRMPPGISVAFIPNAKNAAICTAKVLAVKYEKFANIVEDVLKAGREKVEKADDDFLKGNYEKYEK